MVGYVRSSCRKKMALFWQSLLKIVRFGLPLRRDRTWTCRCGKGWWPAGNGASKQPNATRPIFASNANWWQNPTELANQDGARERSAASQNGIVNADRRVSATCHKSSFCLVLLEDLLLVVYRLNPGFSISTIFELRRCFSQALDFSQAVSGNVEPYMLYAFYHKHAWQWKTTSDRRWMILKCPWFCRGEKGLLVPAAPAAPLPQQRPGLATPCRTRNPCPLCFLLTLSYKDQVLADLASVPFLVS